MKARMTIEYDLLRPEGVTLAQLHEREEQRWATVLQGFDVGMAVTRLELTDKPELPQPSSPLPIARTFAYMSVAIFIDANRYLALFDVDGGKGPRGAHGTAAQSDTTPTARSAGPS